ncbi:MAG TPA: hypothetical protein VI197_34500 [Polyangiaceae bacterium]
MLHARLARSSNAASSQSPFRVSETTVTSHGTVHPVLVITSRVPRVFGAERIEALKKPIALSSADRFLIEQTRERGHRIHLAVFRATNEKGDRLWAFDPGLSSAEAEELGYLITKSLLPVHRRMMANGIALLAHTECGTRECYAMRYGARRLLSELDEAPHTDAALTDVDRWILRNMLFHFALDLEHVTTSLFPNQIRTIERRWSRVSDLVTKLPRHFLD